MQNLMSVQEAIDNAVSVKNFVASGVAIMVYETPTPNHYYQHTAGMFLVIANGDKSHPVSTIFSKFKSDTKEEFEARKESAYSSITGPAVRRKINKGEWRAE